MDVKFIECLKAAYSALVNKDAGTLYYCSDTLEVYKGDAKYGRTVELVTAFPTTGQLINTLYVNTTTSQCKVWNGNAWINASVEAITVIPEESTNDNVPTTKAVADYVDGKVGVKQDITDDNLTTVDKTIVGGINELKSTSDNHTDSLALKQNINDNTLTTVQKTIVGGINELKTTTDNQATTLSSKQDKSDEGLNTTTKTVVGGINELKSTSDSHTDTLALKQDITDNSLATTAKTVVGGINELKTTSDSHTIVIAANTSAIALKQNIADQSLLTQAKTVVGGINELVTNGTGQGWTAGRFAPVTTNKVIDATYGAYVNYLDPSIYQFSFQDSAMLLEGVYLTLVSTVAGNVVLKFYNNGTLIATSIVPVTTSETVYTQPFITPLTGSFTIERDYSDANDTVKTGGVPVTVVVTIVRSIETPPTIGSINTPIIYECQPDATYGNAIYLSATNKYMSYATRVSNLRQVRFYLVSASAVTGNIVLKAYVNGIYQASYVVAVGATPAIVTLDLPGYTGAFQWFRDTDDSRDTLKDGATVTAIMISTRTIEV